VDDSLPLVSRRRGRRLGFLPDVDDNVLWLDAFLFDGR